MKVKLIIISSFILFESCGQAKIESKKNASRLNSLPLKEDLFNNQWYLHSKCTSNSSSGYYYSYFFNSQIACDANINLNLEAKYTGKGVRFLIDDTGVDGLHPNLKNNILLNASLDVSDANSYKLLEIPNHSSSHGTNVAGIVAASGNDGSGYVGIAKEAQIGSFNSEAGRTIYNRKDFYKNTLKLILERDKFAINNNYQIVNASHMEEIVSGHLKELSQFYDKIRPLDLEFYNSLKKNMKTEDRGYIFVTSAGNNTCSNLLAKKWLGGITPRISDSNFNFHDLSEDDKNYFRGLRVWSTQFDRFKTNPYVINVTAVTASGVASHYSNIGANNWISAFGGSFEMDSNTKEISYYLNQGKSFAGILTTEKRECPDKSDQNSDYSDPNIFEVRKNEIKSDCRYNKDFSGTSASAPMVTGVIALMLEANPKLTLRDVKHILAITASKNRIKNSNLKPYCIKILEKSGIFNEENMELWNEDWIRNAAGHSFHNYYGFGIIDADKAVNMSKNYKSPFKGKPQITKEYSFITNDSANDVNEIETSIDVTDDFVIEAIEVEIELEAIENADGISLELFSPNNTQSILLHPANFMIEFNSGFYFSKSPAFIGSDFESGKPFRFLSNTFYEEKSKGKWKLVVKNAHKINNKFKFNNWKIKVIGH